MTDRPSSGNRHSAGADRDRQPLRLLELDADAAQRLARRLDPGLQVDDGVAGGDHEELVRTVAAHRHRLGEAVRDDLLHHEEHVVAGPVAMGVVEQPEVVDVEQRDGERRVRLAGELDLTGEVRDERAVVQRAGERVVPGCRDERVGLAVDPDLRGAEHEVQDARGDDRGA